MTDPAYIQRGNEVQNEFQSYSDALADYYHRLSAALYSEVPELVAGLRAPDTKAPGYQILPRLLPDDLAEKPVLSQSGYSWPQTEQLISRARHRLADLEMQLRRAQSLDPAPRRAALEQLARDYPGLRPNKKPKSPRARCTDLTAAVIAKIIRAKSHRQLAFLTGPSQLKPICVQH